MASNRIQEWLERSSHRVTEWVGSSWAFGIAFGGVIAWAASGPFFAYSDTWQLLINTTTTVVTFLVVFLLQRSQNKDSKAIHIKLNEIVAVLDGASNRLIDVEDLSEAELQTLHAHFQKLAQMAQRESSLSQSHSIEEAEERHHVKAAVRTPAARERRSRRED